MSVHHAKRFYAHLLETIALRKLKKVWNLVQVFPVCDKLQHVSRLCSTHEIADLRQTFQHTSEPPALLMVRVGFLVQAVDRDGEFS